MALVRRVLALAVVLVLLLISFAGGWITGRLGIGSVVAPASLTDLERRFVERMTNVSLVGTFTVAGRDDRPGRPDRYDILGVEKIGDDLWRFNARMRHEGIDMTMPFAVPMRWVGDTPMIQMTDAAIPGIGAFTVRVFFYGDRYAGTWQHGDVGGLMTGRIEKQSGQ
jgi:hypothetical protein